MFTTTTKPAIEVALSSESRTTKRVMAAVAVALAVTLVLVAASPGSATDPNSNCAPHDKLVALLTGKPHFERRFFVLMDEMPGQGHRFELFMNRGEGGRHSYTLIRTRRGAERTCIVTAGVVDRAYVDGHKRARLVLRDENDPDTFDIAVRKSLYVITRQFDEDWLREYSMEVLGSVAPVVSYGRIVPGQ